MRKQKTVKSQIQRKEKREQTNELQKNITERKRNEKEKYDFLLIF